MYSIVEKDELQEQMKDRRQESAKDPRWHESPAHR